MSADHLDLAIDRVHHLLCRSEDLKELGHFKDSQVCIDEAEDHAAYIRQFLLKDDGAQVSEETSLSLWV